MQPKILIILAVFFTYLPVTPRVLADNLPKNPSHQIYVEGVVHKIDREFSEVSMPNNSDLTWDYKYFNSESRFVQFHFKNIQSPNTAAYKLKVFLEPAGKLLATYDGTEFGQQSTFSSDFFPRGQIRISLTFSERPKLLSFTLSHAVTKATSSELRPESFVAPWQSLRGLIGTDDKISSIKSAFALVHVGPEDVACTGILVRKNLVVTNYHCLVYSLDFLNTEASPVQRCNDVHVEFDYLVKDELGEKARCKRVVADKFNDLALIEIDPEKVKIGGVVRAPIKVRLLSKIDACEIKDGFCNVSIVHHPLGIPLVIQKYCKIRGITSEDILHDCQTTLGSSGSAVLDENLELVAVHYLGPYPINWTQEMVNADIAKNGERYNRAKSSSTLTNLIKRGGFD